LIGYFGGKSLQPRLQKINDEHFFGFAIFGDPKAAFNPRIERNQFSDILLRMIHFHKQTPSNGI
jgi:hypothetical protein